MYNPKSLDTTMIQLPVEIDALTEKLAENIHDIWAEQRVQQGWTYGPYRNDEKKEHPNLVPYNQLEEIDKDYDRKTALETLKMIVSFGYTIEKVKK